MKHSKPSLSYPLHSSSFQRGFTIVELLAVIGVFVAIGSFVTSIIISTLRGNNKTNAIAAVQSNGNHAMNQMIKLIHSARSLDSSVTCGTIDAPVSASSFAVKGADGATTTLSCTTDNNNTPIIASNGAALTDANLVKWQSCSFSCGRNTPSDYPVITISFSLLYRSSGSSTFADQTASSSGVQFETAVLMRNQER